MKAVYEATCEIPELGVEPGDLVLVRPAHATAPLMIVRELDRPELRSLMASGGLNRMIPVSGELTAEPRVRVERGSAAQIRLVRD